MHLRIVWNGVGQLRVVIHDGDLALYDAPTTREQAEVSFFYFYFKPQTLHNVGQIRPRTAGLLRFVPMHVSNVLLR